MSTSALAKSKKKLRTRDVNLKVRKQEDPDTGQLIGALVPAHAVDQRSLRERKFVTGRLLLAILRLERNPMFYRNAHLLSGWLADNVELFSGLSQLMR